MSQETHCDHCRELYNDAVELIVPASDGVPEKTWDICDECLKELRDWLPWSP